MSDFTGHLATLYEQHADALHQLIIKYRIKNSEIRKDRPTCHLTLFQAWETFLQEVEADSASASDVANALSKQVIHLIIYIDYKMMRAEW